ncbi:HTH domain-containing protein [Niallia circulans]
MESISREEKTQQEIANHYGLSTSTLQKYIKSMKNFMQPIYS